jgi:butyryl-CoA dehydrogenase
MLADAALAAARSDDGGAEAVGRIALARFFANHVAVQAGGLERTVVEGAASVNEAEAALSSS